MNDGSNILVTGGSGFVGSNLIKRLIKEKFKIRATLHEAPPKIIDKKIEYVQCDLRNSEDCIRISQDIDYVFLCAANTSGAAVIDKSPLVHLTPNILMNTNMLDAAYKNKVKKVLFISSSVVYPEGSEYMDEEKVINSFYEKYYIAATMKRYSEILCSIYANNIQNPMTTIVVRPSNLYGPLDDFNPETSHVIPALIKRVVERQIPLTVWGDGNDIKDFIFIDDFIEGLILSLISTKKFEIYNIASGKEYRLKDILKLIIEIDDYKDARIEYDLKKPTMIPVRRISIEKAKKKLEFQCKISIQQGLRETIRWYRQQNKIKGQK